MKVAPNLVCALMHKKPAILFSLFILLFTSVSTYAARSVREPSIDVSKLTSKSMVVTTKEQQATIEKSLQKRYKTREPDPNTYAFSEDIALNLDLKKVGAHHVLPDGRNAWAFEMTSFGADEVILRLDYDVPAGAEFLAYVDGQYFEHGPLTDADPLKYENWFTTPMPGETVTLVYIEPANLEGSGKVIIKKLEYLKKIESFNKNNDCLISIGCDYNSPSTIDGRYWGDASQAIVMLLYKDFETNTYNSCTGFLINNFVVNAQGTGYDDRKKAYIVTADHCVIGFAGTAGVYGEGDKFPDVVVVFNYRSNTCNIINDYTTVESINYIVGVKVISRFNSDFDPILYPDWQLDNQDLAVLMPLNDQYQENLHEKTAIGYLGWNAYASPPTLPAAVIDHQGGRSQLLSIDNGPIYLKNEAIFRFPDYEQHFFSEGKEFFYTNYEKGYSNAGASGSPLLNKEKQVVGVQSRLFADDGMSCPPNGRVQSFSSLAQNFYLPNAGYPSLRELLDPLEILSFPLQNDGYFPHKPNDLPTEPPLIGQGNPFVLPQEGYIFHNSELPSCSDGILNGDETWMDCGGSCGACNHQQFCYVKIDNPVLSPAPLCADPYNWPPPSIEASGVSSSCSPLEWRWYIDGITNMQSFSFAYQWNDFQYPEIDQFPYVQPIELRLDYTPLNNEPDSKSNLIGQSSDWFFPTVYLRGANPHELEESIIGTCPNSSVILPGIAYAEEGSSPFYKWEGEYDNFLDNSNQLNPQFNSSEEGSFDYFLSQYWHEELPATCLSKEKEKITIKVDNLIATESINAYVGVGQQIELPSPILGDFEENLPPNDYQYSWSPATELDNINKKHPTFTAPLEPENNVLYELTVSKGDNDCSATGKVRVHVKDGPYNLEATAETATSVQLTWEDWSLNGMVKIYVQRRFAGVGSWYNVAVLQDGSLTEYLDEDLEPGMSYEYRLQGVKPNFEGTTTYSNWVTVDLTTSLFTPVAMFNVPNLSWGELKWADYDNDGDLDFWMAGYDWGSPGEYLKSEVYTNLGMQWQEVDGESHLFAIFDDAGLQHNYKPQHMYGLDQYVLSGDWGDYDRDGYLDLVVGGWYAKTHVLRNQSLTANSADFEIVWSAEDDEPAVVVGWAYLSRDHALDIIGLAEIFSEEEGGGFHEYLGNNEFSPRYGYLHNLYQDFWRDVHFSQADYDNDGDTDFLITGRKGKYWQGQGNYTGLHGNKWNHNFLYESENNNNWNKDPVNSVDVQPDGLVQVARGESDWGDYDQDGDLDLVIAGVGADTAKIYRNDGGNQFIDIQALAKNSNHISWVDYDQDGDLDIFLSNGSGSYFYKNNQGDFSEVDSGLPGFPEGTHAWGDYDNDGDLDLLIMGGNDAHSEKTRLYRNELISNDLQVPPNAQEPVAFPANTRPDYPSWFSAISLGTNNLGGEDILFRWGPGSDVETPPEGLTYNLHAEHTETGHVVKHGMTKIYYGEDKWKRTVARPGNVGHSFEYVLHSPVPLAELKWWIQTIDTAFRGSKYVIKQGEVAYKAAYSLDVYDGNVCNGSTFPVSLVQQYEGIEPEEIIWEASGTHTVESSEDGYSAVVTRKEFCEPDEAYCDINITAKLHYLNENPEDAIEVTGVKEVPGKNGVYDTVELEWIEHEGNPAVYAKLMPPTNGGKEADHIYWLTPPEEIERVGDYHQDNLIFKAKEGYDPAALCGVEITANATHECGPNGNFYASAVIGKPLLPQMDGLEMIETPDVYGEMTVVWDGEENQQWLLVMREEELVNQQPVFGEVYNASTVFGEGDDLGDGNYAVHQGNGAEVKITGLTPGVIYHVDLFVVNTEEDFCNPIGYYSVGVASMELASCPVWEPGAVEIDAELLELNPGTGQMKITWTPDQEREWVVLMRHNESVDQTPIWGNSYNASLAWGQGEDLGQQTYVMHQGNESEVIVTGLMPGEYYSVKVFGSREGIPACYSNDYYFGDADWIELSLANPQDDQDPEAATYVFSNLQGAYKAICEGGMASIQLQQSSEGEAPVSINYTLQNANGGQISGQNTQNVKVWDVTPNGLCETLQNNCGLASCFKVKAKLTFDIDNVISEQSVTKDVAAHCGPCQELLPAP